MNRTIASNNSELLVTDTNKQKTPQNLLSYGEASELTGLTYWQLKYATRKGRIDTVPVAGRIALLRDSVLEFAGQK